jgi:hypothetical protein
VAFTAGLLAKPMVVTFPFALLLLDAWPLGRPAREGWRRLVVEKVPLFALSAVVALVTYRVQAAAGAVVSLAQQPIAVRIENALLAYVTYVGQTIWPAELAFFYPPRDAFALEAVLGAAALLLVVTALGVWQWRARPHLLVGWLWFVGTLVPVIGIVHAGDQAMADRFTYIPSIGLGFMGAWTIGELARRTPREETPWEELDLWTPAVIGHTRAPCQREHVFLVEHCAEEDRKRSERNRKNALAGAAKRRKSKKVARS